MSVFDDNPCIVTDFPKSFQMIYAMIIDGVWYKNKKYVESDSGTQAELPQLDDIFK